MICSGKPWIRAARGFRDHISLFLGYQQADGAWFMAKPVEITRESEMEAGREPAPFLDLRMDAAQMLMDQLWDCGIRPSEGSGSAGAFEAQRRHLEDMRTLVFQGRTA